MNRFSLPKELNQPIPRQVKPRKSFVAMIILLTLVFPGLGAYFSGMTYKMCHDQAVLKERGITADAKVTNLKIESGRSSNYYKVTYVFEGEAQSGNPPVPQMATRQTIKTIFEQLRVGQKVPILYDSSNLDRSDINFNDVLHTSDPYVSMPIIMGLIWTTFGGAYLFVIISMLVTYFKEKKLVQFGCAAPATITDTQTIQGRRPSISVTYQFVDEQGETVQSVQKSLPTETQRRSKRFQSYWDNIVTSPVALYDPQDNSKSMLYGSGSVLCCSPEQ